MKQGLFSTQTLLFTAYVIGASLLMGSIHAWHRATFNASVAQLGWPIEARPRPGHWSVLHVLFAECGCSKRVYESLLERGASKNADESVLLLGQDQSVIEALKAKGFNAFIKDPAHLDPKSGIIGAPLLLIADENGKRVYGGGYAERKLNRYIAPRDQEVLTRAMRGDTIEPFPAYGCAVSRNLQAYLDPLQLKYKRETINE